VGAVSLANVGLFTAWYGPLQILLALQARAIAPAHKEAVLGLVVVVGAVFSLLANPLFGGLSDRTVSRFGRRLPWVVGGAVGGAASLVVLASASNVTAMVVGWCLVQTTLNAAFAAVVAAVPDQAPRRQRGTVGGWMGLAQTLGIVGGTALASAAGGITAGYVACVVFLLLATLPYVPVLTRSGGARPVEDDADHEGDEKSSRDGRVDAARGAVCWQHRVTDQGGVSGMTETVERTLAARAADVSRVYGAGETAVRALDGVTAEFPRGQYTAVMGPSGSGKSTLMHCLAGLDRVTSGQVWIGETELSGLSDRDLTLLRRENVGFVFQAFNLLPTLNAGENIELPLAIAGRKPDRAWYDRVIDAVGLRHRLGHRPSELSGGEQQRVAGARALVSRPTIIFADEPTGNLDSRSSAELLGFMRRSVDEFGQTVVMVTHDPTAAGYADRVLFLGDGRIVDEMADPTAERVLDYMKKLGA